jgi:hypothetical protein
LEARSASAPAAPNTDIGPNQSEEMQPENG